MGAFTIHRNENTKVRKRAMGTIMITLIFSWLFFSYAMTEIYMSQKDLLYGIDGILAGAIVFFCIFRKKLWANYDTLLLTAFLTLSLITTMVCGMSPSMFFTSRFISMWMIFLAGYYALEYVSDAKRYIRILLFISAVVLCVLSLYVLIHVSAAIILDIPNTDKVKGCFYYGRLYGIGNANIFGFCCACQIFVSIFGIIDGASKGPVFRIINIVIAFIGWMALGLSGCRTGMVGVSIGLSIFSFVWAKEKLTTKKANTIFSLVISAIVFFVALESFLLPDLIYKGTMISIGYLFSIDTLEGIGGISAHRIADDDGTMSDRTIIWAASIRACVINPRRFFFGISPFSREKIYGIYAGHHEIAIVHAHNTYIEICRKHGILGFTALMSLILAWIVNGLKILFLKEKEYSYVFIVAMLISFLIMGMAEPMPFANSIECFITIPFFLAAGYCMRIGRTIK